MPIIIKGYQAVAMVPVKDSKIPRRKNLSRVFASEAACDEFVALARAEGFDAYKRTITAVEKPRGPTID